VNGWITPPGGEVSSRAWMIQLRVVSRRLAAILVIAIGACCLWPALGWPALG